MHISVRRKDGENRRTNLARPALHEERVLDLGRLDLEVGQLGHLTHGDPERLGGLARERAVDGAVDLRDGEELARLKIAADLREERQVDSGVGSGATDAHLVEQVDRKRAEEVLSSGSSLDLAALPALLGWRSYKQSRIVSKEPSEASSSVLKQSHPSSSPRPSRRRSG